jgi:5-methylcytosine-specific restriction endonuclease McrA
MRSRFPYVQTAFALLVIMVFGWWAYHALEPIPPMPIDQQMEAGIEVETGNDVSIESERSGRWPAVRREFLRNNPCCEACGTTASLHVHHVRPFHLWPELELEPHNLITLCPKCHFFIGHDEDGPRGPKKPNWKTSNRYVWRDARRERALR